MLKWVVNLVSRASFTVTKNLLFVNFCQGSFLAESNASRSRQTLQTSFRRVHILQPTAKYELNMNRDNTE